MITIATAIGLVALLFFILLSFKSFTHFNFCAICVSFTATWLMLSGLYVVELFDSLILIALMAGMTVHGLYNIWEDEVSEKFMVFRLPLLMTLLSAFYTVFAFDFSLNLWVMLGGFWIVFGLMFLYRENSRFEGFVEEVIECCRDW